LLQQARKGQNFDSHVLMQFVELRLEFIADLNGPSHNNNSMPHIAYAVKCIII